MQKAQYKALSCECGLQSFVGTDNPWLQPGGEAADTDRVVREVKRGKEEKKKDS